jgi:SAM-dependent methyltransferase
VTLVDTLKRRRESLLDAHSDAGDFVARCFSGSTYALWRIATDLTAAHCRGLVLDAGSGRGSWRRTILATASAYESIDLAPRGGHRPTWVGDICAMPQVPGERYDTVVCHQVLEHVSRPWDAAREFHRILKPGGRLIVSAPHLSRRHELPHDYFRYTQDGLRVLLQQAGFVDVAVVPVGGLLCFLHHQASFFVPGLLAGVPVVGTIAAVANAPFAWLTHQLDRAIDTTGLLPNGVAAVASAGGTAMRGAGTE